MMNEKRKHIVMAVTNDLVTDQRVHRSCTALTEAGYKVTLVGRLLKGSGELKREYKTERMRLLWKKHWLFYAEYNLRLFLKLLMKRCDVIYANDTDTLVGCYMAAKLKRKPIVWDAHEMFPEVPELVGRERVKRFWRGIEDRIVPKLKYCFTVCESIAGIYRERYGVEMKVVRNVPMQGKRLERKHHEGTPILLYQGAVNIGRGVDWMIDAMEYLEGMRFVVVGDGDELQKMKDYAAKKPWSERIKFKGRMRPEDLRKVTVEADMGISLLDNMGLNYYYSLPNRLADFVQAGVPVLATDFPEIRRVVKGYGIGSLIEGHEAKEIAEKVKEGLRYWGEMKKEEREEIFEKARKGLSWEVDKKVLIDTINTL